MPKLFGMVPIPSFKQVFWTLAGLGGIYAIAMGLLTVPVVQRNATYAHNVNPGFYHNMSNVEQFGFVQYQVQPFTVTTKDGETIYAWHILPTELCLKHSAELRDEMDTKRSQMAAVMGDKKKWDLEVPTFEEAKKSVGLKLLFEDPEARVVLSFHGNAGHLALSHRPATYQQFLGLSTPTRPVHVIAFDYRGFGLSSGSPTEQGVLLDSIAMVSAITGVSVSSDISTASGIAPSRIFLVGQSMGTFISTQLYHEWTLNQNLPAFGGLLLLASFTSLPQLLDSYSLGGILPPILSPLLGYPRIQKYLLSSIQDKWETQRRLIEIVQSPHTTLDLTIMHARDDWEIPWAEGRRNWKGIVEAADPDKVRPVSTYIGPDSMQADIEDWESKDGKKRLRWERIRHGGHNVIPRSEQAKLALMRMMEGK